MYFVYQIAGQALFFSIIIMKNIYSNVEQYLVENLALSRRKVSHTNIVYFRMYAILLSQMNIHLNRKNILQYPTVQIK